jgi:hypothetical protein
MKRYFVALAAACALLLTLAAGPALAGGLLPSPPGADQSVSNKTDQSNEATAVNVPILSGNNVALANGGDQKASAGTTQEQSNQNATSQDVQQTSDPATTYGARGGCGCSEPSGQAGSQEQSVRNETDQSNEATAVNVPIASGNNVALINEGDQKASAGTTQEQSNRNATSQEADQSGSGQSGKEAHGSYGKPSGKDGSGAPEQSVRNETDQSNEATAVNVPIASGNNVALINGETKDGCRCSKHEGGNQTASAGTTQKQENHNYTKQEADQSSKGSAGDRWGKTSESRGDQGSEQSVRNKTEQENEAWALNVPIASGNNVALINGGNQTASAGTTQKQENHNYTKQDTEQGQNGGKPESRGGPKACPKPEPKPCKPKPCPRPEPKPCQRSEPKPKPCEPKPCERGPNGGGIIGSGFDYRK